jgi:hypothetical protein
LKSCLIAKLQFFRLIKGFFERIFVIGLVHKKLPDKVSQASCLPDKNKVCEQDAHDTLLKNQIEFFRNMPVERFIFAFF